MLSEEAILGRRGCPRRRAWVSMLALVLGLAAAAANGSTPTTPSEDLCAKGGLGKGRGWVAATDGDRPLPPPDPIGGVGGTGIASSSTPGSVGTLVGTVTRFGSICVNGVEVETPAGIPIQVRGNAGSAAAIGLGAVVRVRVAVAPDHGVRATGIAVVDAVSGSVTSRDPEAMRFTVMGRRVRLGPASMTALSGPAVPELGALVTVSGIGDPSGEITATRVEAKDPRESVFAAGLVRERDGDWIDLDGIKVRLPSDRDNGDLDVGNEVAVSGLWIEDRIEAETVLTNPTLPTPDAAGGWVSVEGYFTRCERAEQGFGIGGLPVALPSGFDPSRWLRRRVVGLGELDATGSLVLHGLGYGSLDEALDGPPTEASATSVGPCRRPISR